MVADDAHDDQTQSFVALTADTVVSHYRIIEKIGSGGMGEVYLALDTTLNRNVALKFLPLHLCRDETCRKRFIREAQAAAALDHQNIAGIHEVGEYQGRPFYVMQVIDGQSLREVIAGKDVPIDRVVEIGMQVCAGLEAAHDKGIIHRDIKPSNIMLDSQTRVRIVDFGLASIRDSEHLTQTKSTLGTVGYMSPEQARGEEVDQRSDLFSLGVVLYELITKQNPFQRESHTATLTAIGDFVPEPVARFRRNIPERLESVVSKLLEKNPALRYQNAAGVLSDLRRLQQQSAASTLSKSTKKTPNRLLRILIPSLVVMLGALLLILKPWKVEISSSDEVSASENRLAVMYFDNLVDPEDSQKLGEITASLLCADMSESEYIQVVSTQRLYDILKNIGREGQKKIDRSVATQVAEKAKARWMVLGSILRSEPGIIITAQLVDVATGNAIASQRIEGQPDEEIFVLVDKLTVELKSDLSLPAAALNEPDKSVADITSPSTEAYRYYLLGVDYLYKYFIDDARRSFEKAVELDSTFAIAYYYLYKVDKLARGTDQAKLLDKAIANLEHAGERDRYLINAERYKRVGDYSSAIREYQKMIERYPDEKEGYYRLALIYKWSLGDQETAVKFFEKSIELDSQFTEPYNQLTYDYRQVGEPEKSYWAINKYISLRPDEPAPYVTRGNLYFYDTRFDNAIESYGMALQRKPGFAEALYGIGDTYLHKGLPDSAIFWLTRLLDDPEAGERSFGRLVLTHVPLWKGRLSQTLSSVNEALRGDENDGYRGEWFVHKLILKALLHLEIGHPDSACMSSKEAVLHGSAVQQDEFLPYLIQSWIESSIGDTASARLVYASAVAADKVSGRPASSSLDDILGFINFFRGDYTQASVLFNRALQRKKQWQYSYVLTQWMLARSYLESGQWGEAAAEFEALLSKSWRQLSFWSFWLKKTHYYLGITYEKSGWKDQAIEQYRQYLDVMKHADPGIEEVDDTKARLEQLQSGA